MKTTTRSAGLAIALALSAGAAAANPNKLDIDNDGGGRFSGHAGANWTEDQLRQQIGAQICGGTPPRQFDLRILSGYWLFSGIC